MKLNLGCGNKSIEGFIGVDRYPCAAVQVLCDVAQGLPFRDNAVDAVYMDNFIEHVFDIPALMQGDCACRQMSGARDGDYAAL